jgi:hypothetical protein
MAWNSPIAHMMRSVPYDHPKVYLELLMILLRVPGGSSTESSDCIRKTPLVDRNTLQIISEVDAKPKATHTLLALSRVFPIGL